MGAGGPCLQALLTQKLFFKVRSSQVKLGQILRMGRIHVSQVGENHPSRSSLLDSSILKKKRKKKENEMEIALWKIIRVP